tara:strand:+ start:1109 stop:1417 length:309 start_codon:yes stop_codon:yes gene_type:complete
MACSAKAVNVPDRSKAHTPRLDVIGFEEPSSGTERPIGKRPLRAVPKWIGTLPMLFRGNEKLLVMWNCDTWNGAASLEQPCALFQTFALLSDHLLEVLHALR